MRNGFHATSMQDVIAQAELSVGAVYRYSPSKAEIVEAIAEQYSTQIFATFAVFAAFAAFAALAERDAPLAAVMEAAVDIQQRCDPDCLDGGCRYSNGDLLRPLRRSPP